MYSILIYIFRITRTWKINLDQYPSRLTFKMHAFYVVQWYLLLCQNLIRFCKSEWLLNVPFCMGKFYKLDLT